MRRIKQIIVHTAATPQGMDIGVEEIRRWHLERGWDDIGYHFVIRRDGTVEEGRPLERVGAHVKGHNAYSIGICLVGGTDNVNKSRAEFNYTRAQMKALEKLIDGLLFTFKEATVHGHYEFNVYKTCPNFDVQAWWYGDKNGRD